jgi:hypothetical protein
MAQQNTHPDPVHSQDFAVALKWTWLATSGMWLLGLYFLLVFFYAGTLFGTPVQFRYLALTIVASFGGLFGFVHLGYRQHWISVGWLKALAAASITILLIIIAVDVGYSSYLNATTVRPISWEETARLAERDRYFLDSEHFPSRYRPTEESFLINKPNMTMTVNTYGGFYYSGLQQSPTVVDSVLELRGISYAIDEHGFRETTPMDQAHIFALGDSYTFGVDTDQSKVWVEQLEQELGEPTYNLGISGSSPQEQLALLKYTLETNPDTMEIRHLIWMIFENNALNDGLLNPQPEQVRQRDSTPGRFDGTIVQTLNAVPFMIKNQSVINRWLTRNDTVDAAGALDNSPAYIVDGVRLLYPLYHSAKFGYRLFDPSYIAGGAKPESYVLTHPDLPNLHQSFEELASLGETHGFKVTIVITPTPPRLYAPYYEDFPYITEEPYFINYLAQLSTDQGFDVINLYPLLQPYASEELLFWRDDSHFDNRGNEIVAELIATQLSKRVVLDTSAD